MAKGYDEKCKELAEYFLSDVEHTPESVAALAQEIQDSIEAWLETHFV